MNLDKLLATLKEPILVRPTRRMTQSELESYLDTAANILRGSADHSEFRGYVFASLFYKRINDCFEEAVHTQENKLTGAGVADPQARFLARAPELHHFVVPEEAAWDKVVRTTKAKLGPSRQSSPEGLDFLSGKRNRPNVQQTVHQESEDPVGELFRGRCYQFELQTPVFAEGLGAVRPDP